jgi:hypothetical protein
MLSFKEFVTEKRDTDVKVNKYEKGKYKGKTVEDLKAMLKELKDSGPYKEGDEELETERELNFAIRAKTGWGKVTEGDEYKKGDIVSFLDTNGDTKKGTITDINSQKNSKGTKVDYFSVDCGDKIHNVPTNDIKVVNEVLSTSQKEQLKGMFNKAIDRFDDSMSVKDFASVVAEMFYEEWGQHNYSAFMNTWNNVKAQHVDDLEEK